MAYPVRIRDRFWNHDCTDWHWRTLCIVYDAEACGVLERALAVAGIAFDVVPVEPTAGTSSANP